MGKIYIANSGGGTYETKKIYIGDSNNIAREVKKIYIGDTQNIAREVWNNSGIKHKFRLVLDTTKQSQYSDPGSTSYYEDDVLIYRGNSGYQYRYYFTDSNTGLQIFNMIVYGSHYGGAWVGPYKDYNTGSFTGTRIELSTYHNHSSLAAAGYSKISYKGTITNTLQYYGSYLNVKCYDYVDYKLLEEYNGSSWVNVTETDGKIQNSSRQFYGEIPFTKYNVSWETWDANKWNDSTAVVYAGMDSDEGQEFTSGSLIIEIEVEVS